MTMARVLIEDQRIGGQPALHACPLAQADAPLPTVLVYHGFTRSKELDCNLALMLARAGLRVVMPEADGHGERFDGDAAARQRRFWHILRSSLDELPALRADLQARGWIADGRLGVAGLSMGGFVALGALARFDWLRVGVSWMGAAHFHDISRTVHPPLGRCDAQTAAAHEACMAQLHPVEPGQCLDRLATRPLLLWHGERDEVVPFSESARLHAEMRRRGLADRLELVAEPVATHKLTQAGAEAGVRFLERQL